MIQRDYILRMIEQFFAIVRAILRYRETQQHERALETIRQAYKAFLGCDEEFIDSHSADNLISMMNDGILQPEQLVMAAKLLAEQGRVLASLEEEQEAERLRRKSLALYLEVYLGPGAPSMEEYFSEIEDLAETLQATGIALDLAARLPFYFEKRGRYAAAEDALFRAAEAAHSKHRIFDAGLAMYDRLASLPAEDLDAGELPLAEVEEGRKAFEALLAAKRARNTGR